MGLRKPRQSPTPNDMAIADRVRRARPPKLNESSVMEWALANGIDVVEALDLYSERAAIRQYDGAASLEDAEAGALEDVKEILGD